MKLTNIAFIAFSIFTLASCSSENDAEPIEPKKPVQKDLISELKCINQSLRLKYEPLTRASEVGVGDGADLLGDVQSLRLTAKEHD